MTETELIRSGQLSMAGMLASGFAHEIRQPLQVIMATARNAQRDIEQSNDPIDVATIVQDFESIVRMSSKINKIIEFLRALSRNDAVKLEQVNLNEVIEEVLEFQGEQLRYHGINIEKNLTDGLPPIEANKIQLEQVLVNFITNTREALGDQEDKYIAIETRAHNGTVEVKFRDNAGGQARCLSYEFKEMKWHIFTFTFLIEMSLPLLKRLWTEIALNRGAIMFFDVSSFAKIFKVIVQIMLTQSQNKTEVEN